MNEIQFDCPGCGQTIEMPEEGQFERVKCPTCQHEFFPDHTRLVQPAPAVPPPIQQRAMILINCPTCGLQIGPQAASCPGCGHPVALALNQIQYNCPGCGQAIEMPEDAQFERVKCPTCQHEFVPSETPPTSTPAAPPPVPVSPAPAPQPIGQSQTIIATTGNEISGRIIERYIGIARGVVVRSPGLEQQLFGGLKKIVGGNIESFAKVCETARSEAFSRMMEQAKTMNADAIIAMRYDATEFAPGITEVLAYGTAVKLAGADAAVKEITGPGH